MMFFGGLLLLLLVLLLTDHPGARRSVRFWLVLFLALLVFPLLGMIGVMGFGTWNWMHGAGSWSWWGPLGSALILAGLAVSGFWLVGRAAPEFEEEQILRLRLARGEITAEDFDLLRTKLKAQ